MNFWKSGWILNLKVKFILKNKTKLADFRQHNLASLF